MSEDKKDVEFKYIPYATTITKESLDSFPNIKHFFELLLKDTVIETKSVGKSSFYNKEVERNKYFSNYGLFMDYFIRKHLSNQFNIEISDSLSERILNNPDDYIVGERKSLHDAISKHYEIYKDPTTKAMDIIKSVKIVSLSHSIFFKEAIPEKDYTVDENHLREITKYFGKLPYKSVELNATLDCNYFEGRADIIFDKDVIYEIKTSKFKSLVRDAMEIPPSKFYQSLIYGFGYYKNFGIKIKNFKIYNPLVAYEYSIVLDDIDFELYEKVLKRDIGLYSRLKEIYTSELVLDLSLFSQRKYTVESTEEANPKKQHSCTYRHLKCKRT